MASVRDFSFTNGERITKAIVDLQREQPFFADLAMGLRIREMPAGFPVPCRTMAVNGRGELFFDDAFVAELSADELKGVVTHEALHVALSHIIRTGSRDRLLSNFAQDVVVNHFVSRAGMRMPDGGIPYDGSDDSSSFKIGDRLVRVQKVSSKSWEEVYAELHEFVQKEGLTSKMPKLNRDAGQSGDGGQQPPDGDGSSSGPKGSGGQMPEGLMDYHDYGLQGELSEKEAAEIGEFWNQRLVDALARSKQAGRVPGGMERLVEDLLSPRVDWRGLLLRYVKLHTSPVDWSYSRPHRKSQVLEVYLPSVQRESNEVEVVVDTSGSIGRGELTEFLSEVAGMARSMSHLQMHVSFADTMIHDRVRVDDDIQRIAALVPKGGGGTDIEAALVEIDKERSSVPVVVVLTDGHTPFRNGRSDYGFEVIWCISENGLSEEQMDRIPYGLKVKIR